MRTLRSASVLTVDTEVDRYKNCELPPTRRRVPHLQRTNLMFSMRISRPLGSDWLISKIETLIGRRLRARRQTTNPEAEI